MSITETMQRKFNPCTNCGEESCLCLKPVSDKPEEKKLNCTMCLDLPSGDNTKCPFCNFAYAETKKGRKYDDGKLRYDLLPPAPLMETVKTLTSGAQKYEPNNWQQVTDPIGRYTSALMRHVEAMRMGQVFDPEMPPNHYHLSAVICNAIFLLHFQIESEQSKAVPLTEIERRKLFEKAHQNRAGHIMGFPIPCDYFKWERGLYSDVRVQAIWEGWQLAQEA